MIRALLTLIYCLFVVPAFSYDDEAKEEIFLSTPGQVATLSSEPANFPECIPPKISQGTLSNGMRFYSCPFYKFPDNEVTFSIVLKKTDRADSLPPFDFFQEAIGYKKEYVQSAYNITPELYSFTLSIRGNYPLDITRILTTLANYLENFEQLLIKLRYNQFNLNC